MVGSFLGEGLLAIASVVATYYFVSTTYTPFRLLALVFLHIEAAIRQLAKTLAFSGRHYWRGFPEEVRAVRRGIAGATDEEKVRSIR